MPWPPTTGDNFKSFQDLFKRLVASLDISSAELPQTQHKFTDILQASPSAKIALPINSAIMDPAKTIWQTPATIPPSCKSLDRKSYVPAKGAEFLPTRPALNSLVVEAVN